MSKGEQSASTVVFGTKSLLVSLAAQLVKNLPAVRETWVGSLSWGDPLEKGQANPLQYSDLENSMDWIVHGVSKSLTQLSDFHFHYDLQHCNFFFVFLCLSFFGV